MCDLLRSLPIDYVHREGLSRQKIDIFFYFQKREGQGGRTIVRPMSPL